MKTPGDVMLREILENPADNTLRLIYSDWVTDNVCPLLGEFIRLSVECGDDVLNDPDWKMGKLVAQLHGRWRPITWATQYDQWFIASRFDGGQCQLRRGFPTRVYCSLKWWLENGVEVCGKYPIEEVRVYGATMISALSGGYLVDSRLFTSLGDAAIYSSQRGASIDANILALQWARQKNGLPKYIANLPPRKQPC